MLPSVRSSDVINSRRRRHHEVLTEQTKRICRCLRSVSDRDNNGGTRTTGAGIFERQGFARRHIERSRLRGNDHDRSHHAREGHGQSHGFDVPGKCGEARRVRQLRTHDSCPHVEIGQRRSRQEHVQGAEVGAVPRHFRADQQDRSDIHARHDARAGHLVDRRR